jgi:excisionase family DNA binding protein
MSQVSVVPPELAAMAMLLDVEQVAAMLKCSTRHVYRLADAGKMPAPVRVGALVRWSRKSIEAWIGEGCPPCRQLVRSAPKGGK